MEQIASPQNPRLKAALKLTSGRGRKQQNRIIIFGTREVERAFAAGVDIEEVFCCPPPPNSTHEDEVAVQQEIQRQRLLERLEVQMPKRIFELSSELYDKLAYGDQKHGLVAVAKRPNTDFDSLPDSFQERADLLVGILESIEKPGNLGAVVRSADGAGIEAIFVADRLCDPFHPNCIRASLGTVFNLPLVCDSSLSIRQWAVDHSVQIVAARVGAGIDYTAIDYRRATAVLIGNEANGLSQEWRGKNVSEVSIPMQGIADSLNLSASAAVLFYEAVRQRRNKMESHEFNL